MVCDSAVTHTPLSLYYIYSVYIINVTYIHLNCGITMHTHSETCCCIYSHTILCTCAYREGGGCGVALGSFSSCTCSRWESVPHTHTNNTPLKPIQENLTNIPLDCRGDVEVLHVSEGSSVVESESRVLF